MAQLVLGIGTSHGPLLSTPPDMWNLRAQWDRAQMHPYQGRLYSYDELCAARSGENLAVQITPEERRRRYDACQAAIARLAQIWAEAKPDVAVIFGNDQMEIFGNALLPAFSDDGVIGCSDPSPLIEYCQTVPSCWLTAYAVRPSGSSAMA